MAAKDKPQACADCGKSKPDRDFSYEPGVCQDCNLKRWQDRPREGLYLVTDADAAAYAGYNNGLGRAIANRGEYRRAARELGLSEAG